MMNSPASIGITKRLAAWSVLVVVLGTMTPIPYTLLVILWGLSTALLVIASGSKRLVMQVTLVTLLVVVIPPLSSLWPAWPPQVILVLSVAFWGGVLLLTAGIVQPWQKSS